MNTLSASKLPALLATLAGLLLLFSGCAAAVGYLGLPLVAPFSSKDGTLFGIQLGQMGAAFLGLVGGGLAAYHGWMSLRNRSSSPVRLPPFYLFYLAFTMVLGVGQVLLFAEVGLEYLFPFIFLFGASLSVLGALAYAFRRLDWPVTWRQASLLFVSGATLSIIVTLFLHGVLPYIYYLLIEPLGYLAEEFLYIFYSGGADYFERLFFSPLLIFYLLYIAFQAPFPEELAKGMGPACMGRRIKNERQAFALGMASGAGFAVLENMVYQGVYAQWAGWTWGGITALRGIGALDHPLWTGILALALFQERDRKPGWFGRLGRAYLLSVGLHTLWNGGYLTLLYVLGLEQYAEGGPLLTLYGEYVEISLIAILILMTALNWWILSRILGRLQTDEMRAISVARVSSRALAVWALACIVVVLPVGIALGRAWPEIWAALTGQ